MAALLQFTSERRWVRYAQKRAWAPVPVPAEAAGVPQAAARAGRHDALADMGCWAGQVSVAGDDVWVADSTPVECGRSWETAKRSDLAGWAEHRYCASHSRFFRGLHLVEETARHAGHADFLREAIDGTVGE